MTVHYQNRFGDMVFLSGVVHLQNEGGGKFMALMQDGGELILLVDRIEGIWHGDREERGK